MLRVLDRDIEVAVVVEHAGIEQLALGLILVAPGILGQKLVVRKALRGYL